MNSFQIKQVIDNYIYRFYNLFSRISYLFKFRTKQLIKNNISFRNIHAGERCFILGCGPSLKLLTKEQIDFLGKETVFGVNELFKTKFLEDIAPKYYLLLDNLYWGENLKESVSAFEFYQSKGTIFFTSSKAKNVFKQYENMGTKINYLYGNLYPVDKIINNISSNITVSMNVVTTAILIAMYMGFNEIFLLGCDYSAFATPLDTHSYDDGKPLKKEENLAFYLKYYEITTRVHYLVASKAKEDNKNIINLTENSLLDAYPFGDLNDIMHK